MGDMRRIGGVKECVADRLTEALTDRHGQLVEQLGNRQVGWVFHRSLVSRTNQACQQAKKEAG